jgi:hypothetical protein
MGCFDGSASGLLAQRQRPTQQVSAGRAPFFLFPPRPGYFFLVWTGPMPGPMRPGAAPCGPMHRGFPLGPQTWGCPCALCRAPVRAQCFPLPWSARGGLTWALGLHIDVITRCRTNWVADPPFHTPWEWAWPPGLVLRVCFHLR